MAAHDLFRARDGAPTAGIQSAVRSIGVLLVAALVGGSAFSAPLPVVPAYGVYATPGRMVAIGGGRRLNLRCAGTGRVTVIFESGLGFPSYSWRKVQPAVAQRTRACAYDRAGLGFSDPGPLPRSAAAIAGDLAALVDAAGLKPPFVLVGSSLGSQSVRLFAFDRPRAVAGIVLVDPYVEGQIRDFAAIDPAIGAEDVAARAQDRICRDLLVARKLSAATAEARGCIDAPDPQFSASVKAVVRRQRMRPATARTVYSESQSLDTISEVEIAARTRPLGAVPIIVLNAGAGFDDHAAATRPALIAKHREHAARLARLSDNGEVVVVPGASHVIQSSKPHSVIDAIMRLVARAGP